MWNLVGKYMIAIFAYFNHSCNSSKRTQADMIKNSQYAIVVRYHMIYLFIVLFVRRLTTHQPLWVISVRIDIFIFYFVLEHFGEEGCIMQVFELP